MGCDIHFVIEKQVGGKWLGTVSTQHAYLKDFPAKRRNYALFSEVASVRGDSSVGLMPKGVPEDISELARYDVDDYGSDGHSHSYMSVPEFLEAAQRVKKQYPSWEMRDDHMAWDLLGMGADDLSDYRIVFWFDN